MGADVDNPPAASDTPVATRPMPARRRDPEEAEEARAGSPLAPPAPSLVLDRGRDPGMGARSMSERGQLPRPRNAVVHLPSQPSTGHPHPHPNVRRRRGSQGYAPEVHGGQESRPQHQQEACVPQACGGVQGRRGARGRCGVCHAGGWGHWGVRWVWPYTPPLPCSPTSPSHCRTLTSTAYTCTMMPFLGACSG